MKIQFDNIEGYEGEFFAITVNSIEELTECIQETFGWTQEGECIIDTENRYFEYTETEEDIKVTGNY